jgi:hypothetical protein
MAEKRMFSKRVISSDTFLDMPATTQLFYFYLCMAADDDGFVDSTRSVMRSVGAADQDMNTLLEKGFIIYFKEEGISLIRHWQISNAIRKDIYKETKYKELKNRLSVDDDGAYTLQGCNENVTEPLQDRNEPVTESSQNRSLDQISIDQISIDQVKREREEPPPSFSESDELNQNGKNLVLRVEGRRKKWESCKLPPAPIITNMNVLNDLNDCFRTYPDEKIDEAITNFAGVISQPGFDESTLPGGHKPNFKNFLLRWVDRFIDEAKPFEAFKVRPGTSGAGPPSLKGKKSLRGLDSW